MANDYIYLLASLPMLRFDAKPPFSFEKFLERCRGLIPDGDWTILEDIGKGQEEWHKASQPTVKAWHDFDTALRNELVRIRSSRKHVEPAKYLRGDGYSELSVAQLAVNAYRALSVSGYDAERMLDQERWRKMEELALGHYFDCDALVVYALRLKILLRWEAVRTADKQRLLDSLVNGTNRD